MERAARTSGLWSEYRRAQLRRRAERLPRRHAAIAALRRKGFRVEQLSDGHFRVDDAPDLYPVHCGFHDLRTQERGTYRNPLDIAIRRLLCGNGT